MEDAELIKQVLNDNSNAFSFLVAKYQRLVLHVVGRIIKQDEDVEDICQEVFIKVFKKLKYFREESKLSAWIASIAFNTSINYLKKKKKETLTFTDDLSNFVQIEADNDYPLKQLEKKEIKRMLKNIVDKLPLSYRTIISLYYLDEFSYKEISEITGMPDGTVKSYLFRAKQVLKEKLKFVMKKQQLNYEKTHR